MLSGGDVLLSVIVPSLAPDLELRRCVDSLFLALGEDSHYEVIVVTPAKQVASTQAILPNVRVCAESRPSIYAAMNDGAHKSVGRYLYFIGKDDILLQSARHMVAALVDTEPDVLFCDVYYGADGIYSGSPSKLNVLVKNFCHQGIVYKRSTFEKYGPYVRKMRVQADHLLNIKLLWGAQDIKIHYLRKPIVWYSASGYSASQRDPVFWRLYPAILNKYVGSWAMLGVVAYRAVRKLWTPRHPQNAR